MKKIAFLFVGILFSFQLMAQWSPDADENTAINLASGEQAIPKVATSENGTTYVSWFSNESGNYNVRLQKLDVLGNKLWADDALLISDNEAMTWLTDWDMAIDQDDHAILVFQDIRTGPNNIYAYRISPEGEFVWGEDGLALSNNDAFEAAPKVCVTPVGNAVFAWQSDDVIIIQKVAPYGTLLWGDAGITISGSDTYSWPQLMPVGDDDVIMKYFNDSGPTWSPTRHVYAQRYDMDGNTVWAEPAIISNAGGISAWTQVFPFVSDGNDGFFIAWHDDRDMNNMASVFVQHIDNAGQAVFQDNGVEVSLNAGMNHFYANLAFPLGSNEIYVYWNEMNGNQDQKGIYGQKVSSTGERLWTDNGKAIVEVSSANLSPMAARAANTDMVVFYEDYYDAVSTAVKAMKIDVDGNFVWPEEIVSMSSVQSAKIHPDIGSLHNDQWIAVWGDERNADRDIYGQNIQMDGTLGPVEIQGDLEVHPDTVVCDTYGPYYVYVVNNTFEAVTVEFATFSYGYCEVNSPSPSEFPYNIEAGDSLIMEIHVIPGSSASGYVTDYLEITTDAGDFEVVFLVNWDLLGSVIEQNGNAIRVTTFPNPSSGNVWFDIQSAKNKNLVLGIYNSLGKIIRSLNVNNIGNSKEIVWNRKDENGNEVQPGIYTYRIWDGENERSGKIILSQ
ncbi:MAG: T9SS type A sorting domain-containing protein [Chlorobi bacterium]|nr:T9SS type A sorting domain-containing protein [Chlorobiota bacterium]